MLDAATRMLLLGLCLGRLGVRFSGCIGSSGAAAAGTAGESQQDKGCLEELLKEEAAAGEASVSQLEYDREKP